MEKLSLLEIQKGLVETRDVILHSLGDNDTLKIYFKTNFDQMINKLGFITNQRIEGTNSEPMIFPPVTNFMGEPIVQKKLVEEEQLTPDAQRKADFAKRVEKLESNFDVLTDEEIIENSPHKDDLLAIRAVAKKAGLEDFKTAKLNASYVAKIREARKEEEEDEIVVANENAAIDFNED